MVIGILRVVLAIGGAHSLKEKRAVLRKVLDRARHRFNAAVAEVGFQDRHQRAEIGVSVVSADQRHANQMVDAIACFFEEQVDVITRKTEFVVVGGDVVDDDFCTSWSRFE